VKQILEKLALLFLIAGLCPAQSLAPAEALNRYLLESSDTQAACSGLVFDVRIDASLPKLRRQGSVSGLKVVSQTGQSVYRGLRFTGDKLVKNEVIARFLANDTKPLDPAAGVGVTQQNYSFVYDKTSIYNGLIAYVFRLRPKRRRVGLFKGELWLDAATAAPLRLWGDFTKSPSLFIRGFRFVEDYQDLGQCHQPVRLLLTIRTRAVGEVEMALWLHSLDSQPQAAATGASGADSLVGGGLER
jgi:hypothetical protein